MPSANERDTLTKLITNVSSSVKYRHIAPELIHHIGAQELTKRNNLKAAVKATKNKLHQITGAYWEGQPPYAQWLTLLREAADNQETKRAACQTMIAHHASTRERIPLLHEFYTTLFAGLPTVTTVLDLACGLNPLTIPWMNLPAQTRYYACDINCEQIDFIHQALPLLGVSGGAFLWDLLQGTPAVTTDVALLLKTIPCLEQIVKGIGSRLLHTVNASTLIVSFPAQSLGGRNKGMGATYATHFAQLLTDIDKQHWTVETFRFATEIVYRLRI